MSHPLLRSVRAENQRKGLDLVEPPSVLQALAQMLCHGGGTGADGGDSCLQLRLGHAELVGPPVHFVGLVHVDARGVLRAGLGKVIAHFCCSIQLAPRDCGSSWLIVPVRPHR